MKNSPGKNRNEKKNAENTRQIGHCAATQRRCGAPLCYAAAERCYAMPLRRPAMQRHCGECALRACASGVHSAGRRIAAPVRRRAKPLRTLPVAVAGGANTDAQWQEMRRRRVMPRSGARARLPAAAGSGRVLSGGSGQLHKMRMCAATASCRCAVRALCR